MFRALHLNMSGHQLGDDCGDPFRNLIEKILDELVHVNFSLTDDCFGDRLQTGVVARRRLPIGRYERLSAKSGIDDEKVH